ncbi:lasso peptide biosynthesis PqqD family chaperone [Paenibacillus sp. YYML68]|uniref:lasso peptide biosynthesis PqqD family chaperone n=1 Tax=Paenibacillus sp. YYML68 TaxID=2909250 RepID=UPI002492EC50|nr:lasso peptide biosynthesis PqqD family chaperone [Paenibacillus sp. YYML68]
MEKTIELHSLIARNGEVLTSDLDGEIGMFHVETGKYYTLGRVSADIWQLLEQPLTLEQLVEKLMEQYEVDQATCAEQTIAFLLQLNKINLVSIQ